MNYNIQNLDSAGDSAFSSSTEIPSSAIDPKHFKEWTEGSGVDEDLTRLNIESVSGDDIFYFLRPEIERKNGGKPTRQEHKFYYQCEKSSGWLFRPVDLDTGAEMEWGQFKADSGTPLTFAKYQSPKGSVSQPFLMKITSKIKERIAKKAKVDPPKNEEFWQWFLKHPEIPLVITEGVKKAGCLLSQGIPCVGLVGVWNAYIELTIEQETQKILHPTLSALCEKRKVYIIFDSDPRGKVAKDVRDARQKLAIAISLEKSGTEIFLGSVPGLPDEKVGVDDYVVNGGNLETLFHRAVGFKDWMNPKRSKNLKAKIIDMSETLNGRLKLNKLTNSVELDHTPVDWNLFRQKYAMEIDDHPYGRDLFADIALAVADYNSYHPVRDYLDSLKPSNYNLDEVAVKYFGAKPGSLQCRMVRKWLISAVARTYQPGCKADSALILYAPKGGEGKSTWLRTLCPDPTWFCDDMGSPEDKDQLLKMHQHWIIEWAELDCILGFKNDSAIKSAISCAADNIRPPYGRSTVKMPRCSILCGTTNKREFLVSSGGDRRYWLIECKGMIDNKRLEQERDLIWGAAKAAFESGEGWYLEYAEQQELSVILSDFKLKREGQEEIEEFLESLNGRTVFFTQELTDYMEIPKSNQKFTMQARRILEELGWKGSLVSIHGKKKKGYKYLENSGNPNGFNGNPNGNPNGFNGNPNGNPNEVEVTAPQLNSNPNGNPGNPNKEVGVTASNSVTEGDRSNGNPGNPDLTRNLQKVKKEENEVSVYTSISQKMPNSQEILGEVTGVTAPNSSLEMAQILDEQVEVEDCKGAKEASPKFVVGDTVFINDLYLASHYGMTWGMIWKVHQDPETGYIEYELQLDGKITQPIKEADLQLKKS